MLGKVGGNVCQTDAQVIVRLRLHAVHKGTGTVVVKVLRAALHAQNADDIVVDGIARLLIAQDGHPGGGELFHQFPVVVQKIQLVLVVAQHAAYRGNLAQLTEQRKHIIIIGAFAVGHKVAAQQDQIRGKAADILHQLTVICSVFPQMQVGQKNDPATLGQLAGMDLIELCRIVGAVIADILPQRPAQQGKQGNKNQQRQQHLLPEGRCPLCAAAAVCVSAALCCAFSVFCFDKGHILSAGERCIEKAAAHLSKNGYKN